MVHALFDTSLKRQSLPCAQDDHDHLAGLQHSLHTDRQRHLGHLFDVVVEEAAVGEDSVVRQSLDSGA